MVADLRYFNSLEIEVDSLRSQLETQKTQLLNEIDRLYREYYYVDHMNAILGVYTELDEVTNLQCDYLELLEKCEGLETNLSKNKMIPQLKSNPQGDRVMHNNSQGKKQAVEDHRRSVKLSKNKTSVTACNDSLNAKTLNIKYISAMCDKCVLIDKHDMCVLKSVAKPFKETVASESNKKPRNLTRKLYERVSKTCSWWYPKFTPSGYKWKLKFGKENVNPNVSMPLGNASSTANVMDTMTSRRSTVSNTQNCLLILLQLVEIVLFIVESGCSKHMTGNLKLLINFVVKFLGTVKFGNDQIAPILGYGDLVQGAVTIKRVYYVEGLNHNLFSVGQFCDADLEVAFRKSTCFIRDLKGNDILIERSRMSHTSVNNGNSKESFNKQTTVLEKRMDESIPLDKKCQSSIEIFKVKTYVNTIITGVELCKEKMANRTYSGYIDPFIQNTIKANIFLLISRINAGLEQFHSLNAKTLNVNSVCATCDTCVLNDKHDRCVLHSVAKPIMRTVASESNQKPKNITRKLYEHVSKTCSWWYPKFTPSGFKWKPKSGKENVNLNTSMPLGSLVEIVLFIVDSGCLKHMTGNLKLLINFVDKFLGMVKFGNDQIAPILGYEDLFPKPYGDILVIFCSFLALRKKVIITKATVREAIRLDDAKSIDCFSNEEIFTELSRMGYEKPSTKLTFYMEFFSQQWKFLIDTILQCLSAKKTSWNEFSSSMASARRI
nr:integrase, catalytic region, zinc finger, CCHC-type, peptidase aspartic, catalytic [Tanacetum cinerariifolium]